MTMMNLRWHVTSWQILSCRVRWQNQLCCTDSFRTWNRFLGEIGVFCKVDFSALKIKFGLYSNKAIKNRLINLGIIQVGLRILIVLFRSVNIFGIVQKSKFVVRKDRRKRNSSVIFVRECLRPWHVVLLFHTYQRLSNIQVVQWYRTFETQTLPLRFKVFRIMPDELWVSIPNKTWFWPNQYLDFIKQKLHGPLG